MADPVVKYPCYGCAVAHNIFTRYGLVEEKSPDRQKYYSCSLGKDDCSLVKIINQIEILKHSLRHHDGPPNRT